MIDLKNTYIENDFGELREAYLKECDKQGIKWQGMCGEQCKDKDWVTSNQLRIGVRGVYWHHN